MSSPELEFTLHSKQWGGEENWRAPLTRAAEATLAVAGRHHKKPQISVLLTDDAEIAACNARWRGKAEPTNVLSFPAPDIQRRQGVLGDIALSHETLAREAGTSGKSLQQHALHLFVHGLLHLLGHDHETEPQAKKMEALERKILLELGVPDPYEGIT